MNKESLPKDIQTTIIDKPITTDRLKIEEKTSGYLYNGISRIPFQYPAMLLGENAIAIGLTLVLFYDMKKAYSTKKRYTGEHELSNHTFGYYAERFVYEGNPLPLEKDQLKKGDNFYHIQLPRIQNTDKTGLRADQLANATDVYELSLLAIKKSIADKNYKAVVIETGTPELNNNILPSKKNETDRQTLFTNKPKLHEPQKKCIVLSRESFENITKKPEDALSEAAETLKESLIRKGNQGAADRIGSMVKKLTEQPDTAKNFKRYLRKLFETEIDNIYGETRGDAIQKQTITIESRQMQGKTHLVKISTSGDRRKEEPFHLDLNQSIDQIRTSLSPVKIALLAHALEKMVMEKEREPAPPIRHDPLQAIKDLTESNVQIEAKKRIDPKFKLIPRKPFRALRPILTTLALGAAFHTAQLGLDLGDSINPGQKTNIVTEHKPAFPDGTPKGHLEWKIKEHGLQHEGYYTLSTGHTFTNDKWKLTTNKPKVRELPTAVPSTIPSLLLEKSVTLDLVGDASFKLPIRDETTVGALKIVDKNGQKVPYKSVQYEDSTIGVTIDNGLPHGFETVKVQETLIFARTVQESVHATKRIASIDTENLSLEARRLAASSDIYQLKTTISKKIYSLNPSNKDVLEHTDGSPESFVDASVQLDGLSCDIANSEFALTSSALENRSPFVNIAEGYLNIDSPAGNTASYLDDLALHTFTVDEDGLIFDATPSTIAKDSLTQDYIKALQESGDLNGLWKQQAGDKDKKSEFYRLLELMGLAGAAGMTTALGYKGSKEIKTHVTRENVQIVKEKTVLRFFEKETVANASNFFGWLSWGASGGKQFNKLAAVPVDSKDKIAEMIRMNTYKEDLDDYIKNPQKYEAMAKISNRDAQRFRLLARYLRR